MYNTGKYYINMFDFESKFCFLISNTIKYYRKKVYACSAGTFCFIQNLEDEFYDEDSDFYFIKIPSGESVIFNVFSKAVFGRVSNIFHKYIRFSSFSKKFSLKKKKQTTRGIAKNPVDHPNGGRSKIKHPFKNPWGFVAKKK